jgi:hypothetical protein
MQLYQFKMVSMYFKAAVLLEPVYLFHCILASLQEGYFDFS